MYHSCFVIGNHCQNRWYRNKGIYAELCAFIRIIHESFRLRLIRLVTLIMPYSLYSKIMPELRIRNKVVIHIESLRRLVDHGRFRVRVIRSWSSSKIVEFLNSKGYFSLGITEMFTRCCRRPGERSVREEKRGRGINLHCLVFVCYKRQTYSPSASFVLEQLRSHIINLAIDRILR